MSDADCTPGREPRSVAASIVIFCVRRSRREMYIAHGRLCVSLCVCLSLAAFPNYCTNPDV